MKESKKNFLLFILFAVSAILRLYKWNSYGLCYDESMWLNRLFLPKRNFLELFTNIIYIAKPPFFRFLLYLWKFLAKDEFTLRLLPFTFGILSILLTYKLGKILFDEKIAFIATFLLTISPFHIYYSQELTHYTLTLFLVLCSVYYFLFGLEQNRLPIWIKFIFFTILSLYTSYISVFLVIFENIFFFLLYKKHKALLKRWLIVQLIILLLYSPWLILLPKQFKVISLYPTYFTWIPKGSLLHILQTLRIFSIGYNANFLITLFTSLIFYSFLILAIYHGFKNAPYKTNFLILWLFLPMILSILFSNIVSTFTYRNFFISLPAFLILIAYGISKIKRINYIIMLLFFIMFLSGLALFNYYQNIYPYPSDFYRPGVHPKRESREAAYYIINNLKDGDVVFHTCPGTASPFIYYLLISGQKEKLYNWPKYLLSEKNNKEFVPWSYGLVIENIEELSKFIKDENRRIWLVLSFWEPNFLDQHPFSEPNKIKRLMDRQFILKGYKEFTGIKVYLYEIPDKFWP